MYRNLPKILYKNKLKMCNQMGFKYGTRNNMLICKDFNKITDGAIERKIRQNKIGDFIANNLIYQYKRHKNNYFFMQELVDDAFTAYRWVSYVKSQYNKFVNKQFVKVKRLN